MPSLGMKNHSIIMQMKKRNTLKKTQGITLLPWSALFGEGAKKYKLSWEKKTGTMMEIVSYSRQMGMVPMIVLSSMQWS